MPSKKNQKSLATDRAASDIVELDKRQKVLNGILAAKSDKAISDETGIPRTVVKKLKNEIRGAMTRNYHDQIEYVRAVAFSRLERLTRLADGMTFGNKPYSLTGMPDVKWANFYLNVIKTQLDVIKTDYDRFEDTRANSDRFQYNDVKNITLIAKDDMFAFAAKAIWNEVNNGATGADYHAMLLEDIVESRPDNLPDFAEAQSQLGRIERTFGVLDEDLPDDDEE